MRSQYPLQMLEVLPQPVFELAGPGAIGQDFSGDRCCALFGERLGRSLQGGQDSLVVGAHGAAQAASQPARNATGIRAMTTM